MSVLTALLTTMSRWVMTCEELTDINIILSHQTIESEHTADDGYQELDDFDNIPTIAGAYVACFTLRAYDACSTLRSYDA